MLKVFCIVLLLLFVFILGRIVFEFGRQKVPLKDGIIILFKNLTTNWDKQIQAVEQKLLKEYIALLNEDVAEVKDFYTGQNMDDKINQLFDLLNKLNIELAQLSECQNELRRDLELLRKSKTPITTDSDKKSIEIEQIPNIFPCTIYCGYGYLNSNLTGFMEERLNQSWNNKTETGIFIITKISENDSIFDINKNEKDLILISTATDTFRATCEVSSPIPANLNNVTINTTPGSLVKNGDIWKIIDRIKIDFVTV